jgi:Tol biopolymer transport system component
VSAPRGGTTLAWSPDRAHLVYTYIADHADEQLHVIGAAGQGDHVITQMAPFANPLFPSWSPDGNFIVFSAQVPKPQIFVVRAAGGAAAQLTSGPGAVYPAWSPDGSHIVFCQTDGTVNQVFVMDADGSNLRQLTSGGDNTAFPRWR